MGADEIRAVAGCPLRIQWGRPRPLGNIDRAQASRIGREFQRQTSHIAGAGEGAESQDKNGESVQQKVDLESLIVPPPTDDTVEKYPSQVAT